VEHLGSLSKGRPRIRRVAWDRVDRDDPGRAVIWRGAMILAGERTVLILRRLLRGVTAAFRRWTTRMARRFGRFRTAASSWCGTSPYAAWPRFAHCWWA